MTTHQAETSNAGYAATLGPGSLASDFEAVVSGRRESLLSAAEWRSLIAVWVAVGVALVLTQVFRPAAGLWFTGWVLWAMAKDGGRLLPALLLAAVPVSHNVTPIGINLSIVEVGIAVAGLASIGSAPRRLGPLFAPVAAYLVVCSVSMAVAFHGKVALTSLVQTGVYLVLTVSVFGRFVRDERQVLLAAVGLIGTSLFLSLLSTAQGGGGFLFGIHKNNVGATTSAATVCAMAVWLHVRQNRKPGAWTGVLMLLSLGLFMTLSRGAWAAAVAGGLCLAAAYRQWRVVGALAVVGVPVAIVGFLFLDETQQTYVLGSVDTEAHSFGTREVNAAIAWDYFLANPVIGSGLGLRKTNDATNVVLFTMAETGMLGLGAFLAIHFAAAKTLLRTHRLAPPGTLTLMAAGLALALVFGRLAHGLVDHYWSRGAITAAWCLVGVALALQQKTVRERRASLAGLS